MTTLLFKASLSITAIQRRFHPPSPRLPVVAMVVCGLLVMGGCKTSTPFIRLAVVDVGSAMRGVMQRSIEPAAAGSEAGHVRLAGASNETLSFRFVLQTGDTALQRPDMEVSPLTSMAGEIASSAVELWRIHPVVVDRWPGWHVRAIAPDQREPEPFDVLVPLRAPRGGLPLAVPPASLLQFWVDVSIPPDTSSGEYTGRIELRSNGTTLGRLDVHLTVWPFTLPEMPSVSAIAEVDHRSLFSHHVRSRGLPYRMMTDAWGGSAQSDRLDGLLASTLRMLRKHRLTPVLNELAPIVTVTARTGVELDWRQYDAVVEPCLSGQLFSSRQGLLHWPLPVLAVFPSSRSSPNSSSPAATRLVRQYFANCAEHFARRGWLDRGYVKVPTADVIHAAAFDATRDFAELARSVTRGIAVASTLFPQDLAPRGWVDYPHASLDDAVDIWMPAAQFYDVEAMASQRAAGRRTWMSVDRPPFSGTLSIQAPLTSVRVLPWQAESLEAGALFLGCINHWPDAADNPGPQQCIRADANVLLYPGGPFGLTEPVASVRLKELRRGLQDAAYLELLRDNGLEHVATTLRNSIAAYAGSEAYRTHFADGKDPGWAQSPELFEAARHLMADALVAAHDGHRRANRTDAFAQSAAWRGFIHTTRKLEVRVDGVRARLVGTPDASAVEVACSLSLFNGTRIPISGSVRFVDLPVDWTSVAEGEPVRPIDPGAAGRATLLAQVPRFWHAADGHVSLPVEVATTDGMVHRVAARVSMVTALPMRRLPRIDGDLSDWPAGVNNVAAGFRLISGDARDESPHGRSTPKRATTVFVLRDKDYLYLAVNSVADAPPDASATRRKSVFYDDMIPLGEELVEILIDPLNVGTRSPTDLYHIVVKQTGTDLVERGIRFDPPCGIAMPWPVDLEVATTATPGRWIAELRIPLAAFGPAAFEQAVWGFNVTRFDAVNQEFSTWSGAVHNAYDPLSLGNLYLPHPTMPEGG